MGHELDHPAIGLDCRNDETGFRQVFRDLHVLPGGIFLAISSQIQISESADGLQVRRSGRRLLPTFV